MLQDLGIGYVAAHSPQAKGRIERLWSTLQDRLTSELRLRGISTLEGGNAFLPEFLADFTRRFARPPADATPAWRPVPRDLADLLSCRYQRTVARDNTVHLGLRWVQIPPGRGGRSYSGCRVEVRELLDGRLLVFYQGAPLASQPSPGPAFVLRPRAGPGETRRRPRRGALSHALRELERAQLTRTPALSPVRAEPTRPGGAERRDREGSRSLHTPETTQHPHPASASSRRRNSPTHPWNRTFSRRQRALNAARATGGGHFYLTVRRTFLLNSDSGFRPAFGQEARVEWARRFALLDPLLRRLGLGQRGSWTGGPQSEQTPYSRTRRRSCGADARPKTPRLTLLAVMVSHPW